MYIIWESEIMRLKDIFIRAAICFAIGIVVGIGIIFFTGDIKEVETRKETIETTEPMNIDTEEPTKLEKETVKETTETVLVTEASEISEKNPIPFSMAQSNTESSSSESVILPESYYNSEDAEILTEIDSNETLIGSYYYDIQNLIGKSDEQSLRQIWTKAVAGIEVCQKQYVTIRDWYTRDFSYVPQEIVKIMNQSLYVRQIESGDFYKGFEEYKSMALQNLAQMGIYLY